LDARPGASTSGLEASSNAGAILVAVNGRSSGWQALDWAAAESAACRASLRIVHVAAGTTPIIDPIAGTIAGWTSSGDLPGRDRVLDMAANRARQVAPAVTISTQLESGNVARAIRNAAKQADLIVVGRGRRAVHRNHATSSLVARTSSAPVAVVELTSARTNGPSAGRVVVGVNSKGGPPAALRYAFQAAVRRGTGLTAIHAWEPSTPSWWSEVGGRGGDLRSFACLDSPLQEYVLDHPEIDVRGRLVGALISDALVVESRAAALLVVGARPQGPIHHALFSSVARVAIRWAESPVAVVNSCDQSHADH